MEALDELLTIERRLWSNDAGVYAATYLPNSILIFPEVGRITRDDAVKAICHENETGRAWAEIVFENEAMVEVLPDVRLLAYRAIARWNDRVTAECVDCLTVYVRRAGHWRVAAHQQTEMR